MFHPPPQKKHFPSYSTDSCTVATTPPVDNQSNCEVNLGLAMQYHFVGLDKHEIDMPRDNENPDNISHDVEKTVLNDQSISNDRSFSNNQSNGQPTSPSNVDANDQTTTPLDDNAIEEGDEHTRQITGGPLTSLMSNENPEAFNEIVCVAPAEGQR